MYGLHRFLILYFILFSCDLGWLGGRTSYCSYVIYQPSPFLYLPFCVDEVSPDKADKRERIKVDTM